MFPAPANGQARGDEVLADRVESLVAWVQELDGRLSAAEAATSDPKAAKELRKAVEAVAKHDPKLEDRVTNQVDVLKDRLAMLAETVSTTSAGLAARDGEMAALRRELEAARSTAESALSNAGKGSGPGAGEVEELRRAIADLSKRSRGGRRDPADGVPGKLEILEQRLDTLAKTLATTSNGLASKEGELAALKKQLDEDGAKLRAALTEVRAAVDPAPIAELRINLKELTDRTASIARGSRQGLDGLQAKLDSVAGQLETLGQSVAATAGGLASGERDLAALRAAFDEETGRLDSHVASMEQILASVTPKLATLGELADRDSVEALEAKLDGVAQRSGEVAGRLEALALEVQDTGRGYAERELELAALSRRFEEAQAGVEGLVAEVRAEVQALAEAGATEALEARLEGVARQLEDVQGRLLQLDEASTGAREEASGVRQELAGALEQVAGRIEALERAHAHSAGELARALEASTQERESLAGGARLLEERVHGFAESMETLSGRLEALSSAVEETGQASDERERQVAALASRFEEGKLQVDALVSDLRVALETMPEPGPDPEQEARLQALADDVQRQAATLAAATESGTAREREIETLGAQLTGLQAAIDGTTRASAERELELAALSRRFEEAQAGAEGLVAEVRTEVQALAEAGATEALEARLEGVARQLEDVQGRLLQLDEASTGAREEASGVRQELAGALEQVAGRIEALERAHAHSAGELARALEASTQERESLAGGARLLEERVHGFAESMETLSRRLEALSSAVEETGQAGDEREREVAALASRFEEGKLQVDALVSDLRVALETMPEPGPPDLPDRVDELGERLDAVASEMQSWASREQTDRLLGKLLLRLDSVEHAQEALTGELARSAGATTPLEAQVAELRNAVEGLGERLASDEREAARLADKQELAERLNAVTRRLEQIERGDGVGSGDGRLRIEMRGLELRVEQAEDVARENREAVLTQLERLASRIEWRLQRLEDDEPLASAGGSSAAEGQARVVPIRGSEV